MNSLDKMEEEKMREAFEVYWNGLANDSDDQELLASCRHAAWYSWKAAIAHANTQHSKIIEDCDRLAKLCEKQAEEIVQLKAWQIDIRSVIDGYEEQLSASNATIAMLSDELSKHSQELSTWRKEKIKNILSNTQAAVDAFMAEHDAKMLAKAKEDNCRGFSLWFSREEWGGIIDGLMLEIERSGGRKKSNSESTSDVRLTMCERILAAINNACELRASANRKDE